MTDTYHLFVVVFALFFVFFFKQKTAYEMRISDWSSDVCSSDLLACNFCQNHDISKSREMDRLQAEAQPEAIAATALRLGCRSVAFTYNDPVIFHEYARDIAIACREAGVRTVAVTARSAEQPSELQSLIRRSYAVLC